MSNIYLAKPGGQKEGPYSLDQINRDLAAKKINDTDFWAWHEGLPQWMPLHSVPGVSAKVAMISTPEVRPIGSQPSIAPTQAKSETGRSNVATTTVHVVTGEPQKSKIAATSLPETEPALIKRVPETSMPATKVEANGFKAVPAMKDEPGAVQAEVSAAPIDCFKREAPTAKTGTLMLEEPEPVGSEAGEGAMTEPDSSVESVGPKPSATLANLSMASGKPFSALDQIFVFTSGAGPSAFKSEITTAMLSEAVGESLETIRTRVPADVIGGADPGVLKAIRAGTIPGSAWRALFKIRPSVAEQIQNGAYHLCVRTFPVESKELVALFLLYSKQGL